MKLKKPKLVFLVPRYGGVDRGVETFTTELAERIRSKFEITILSQIRTTSNTKKVFCIPESNNQILKRIYTIHPVLTSWLDTHFLNPFSFEMLTFALGCLPHLLFGEYDIVFAQGGVWSAIVCRMVRKFKRLPFVYKSAGGIEPPIIRQKPDVYVATTPRYRDWIKRYRPQVYVRLIPNGVDLNKFNPRVRKVRLPLERPIFMCAAALIPAKNIELAIQAVAKLKHGSLLVIGDGPLKDDLLDFGNQALGKERFLLKCIHYTDMPRYYAACDVFTLPSEREPFGIVYIEALAANKPVVARDDRNRRYIVGSAGILCDVYDLDGYAQALSRAASRNFGNLPLLQAKKFSWNRVATAHTRTLLKVLSDYGRI